MQIPGFSIKAAAIVPVAARTPHAKRNLGLIVGTLALGAVFAWATPEVTHATAQSVASGLHATFGGALVLILLAGAIRHRY